MLGIDEVNYFKANIGKLAPQDQSFAYSLASKIDRGLTDKQWFWVQRLLDKMMGLAPLQDNAFEEVGDFSKVLQHFATAKQSLKYPKITLKLPQDNGHQLVVVLSVAGPSSKRPGCVNVCSNGGYYSKDWFGRVTPEGVWEPSQKIEAETAKFLRGFLKELAANPTACTKKYGQLSGHCMYCNSPLTDPKSKSAGYGQTCAKHWGLPWGSINEFFTKEVA
jgi:hypothetical protein